MIDKLKLEGIDVEMIFFHGVPNKELRYYQAQADIVVDMLTYGFFGAEVREAMMLGKPVVCYLRDEWLDQMRAEIPEYVDETPDRQRHPRHGRGGPSRPDRRPRAQARYRRAAAASSPSSGTPPRPGAGASTRSTAACLA